MSKYSNIDFQDLDITKAELKEIGEALKKEEFCKLLSEYVDEVNDPKNRKLYEKEITELEKQRGVDITFVHPHSGYVIKSSVNGVQKAFINICSNSIIGKPQATMKVKDGIKGSDWTIPHVITPPKVDLDKKGRRCVVYDVVFNPISIEISKKNNSFKSLLNDTAITGIEDAFNTKIDRNNVKFPKLEFKGPKVASILRKKSKDNSSNAADLKLLDIPNYPYEPIKLDRSPKITNPRRCKDERSGSPSYTTPHYIIKHRKGVDLQEFTYAVDAKMNAALPSELVIEIDLPLLSSVSDAALHVTSRTLSLITEKLSKYKLDINLPYCVNEDMGSAQFEKKIKKLIVTLPVVQMKFDSSYFSRDDSGIESDPSHNRSSSDEDLSFPKVEMQCDEINGSENTLRTSEVIEFLNENVRYTLPSFGLICDKNNVSMTLNVKNIDPSTVFHQFIHSCSGVHFKFSSLGAGCFPIYYAICVQFPEFIIESSTLKVEVWDNNLIINMNVTSLSESMQLIKYFVGLCPKSFMLKYIKEREMACKEEHKDETVHEVQEELNNIKVAEAEDVFASERSHSEIETLNLYKNDLITNQNGEDIINETSISVPAITKQVKVRTSSESTVLPVFTEHLHRRSILKTSRSLSESLSDECAAWSSLDSSDITEDSVNAVKKTVRFSDVISKKIFRANSSILGQKHKNEKKSRNRKKVARRRISSESENSEVSDFSEVSDLSDLSEASDASSDDQSNSLLDSPTQLPSSKRHRRRGSKNRRKNAATAKQNSFILSQD